MLWMYSMSFAMSLAIYSFDGSCSCLRGLFKAPNVFSLTSRCLVLCTTLITCCTIEIVHVHFFLVPYLLYVVCVAVFANQGNESTVIRVCIGGIIYKSRNLACLLNKDKRSPKARGQF